jgi:hypothetical protein
VVDEAVGQTADDTAQAEPVASEEPVAASETDLDGDAASVEPEAVPEPAIETTEPTLDSLFEQHPDLRTQYDERLAEHGTVRENAGAQRRESELRREAGSREQTAERIKQITHELGVEIEDPAKLNFAYDLANANSTELVMKSVAKSFTGKYGYSAEQQAGIDATIEAQSGDELISFTSKLVDGAVAAGAAAVIRELDGPDVTEESAPKLFKWIKGEVVKRQEADMAADAKETKLVETKSDPLPQTSVGPPPGQSLNEDPASSYAAASRAYNEERITNAEYAELRKGFGIGR